MELLRPHLIGARPGNQTPTSEQRARRGNRRRLAVFGGVFLVALASGQGWNYARQPIYQAATLLQVSVPDAGRGEAQAASSPLADSVPLMTSRPLLAQVARTLATAGLSLPAEDGAAALQAMLRVQDTPAADVVRVQAVGDTPALLVAALRALPDELRLELTGRQQRAADDQLEAAKAELARLDQSSARLRTQLDTFRRDASVQAERDEDEAVARARGLNTALATATEKEAAAEARLRAMTDAAGAGRDGVQAKDNPALSSLDMRANQVREELRDLERLYTAQFLAMDPRARALRAKLADLESQAVQQRSVSQTEAVRAAQEDLATARNHVERLKRDQADARPALHRASIKFGQAKVLEDDLAQVDKARRELLERVTRLEADQQRRVSSVAVLEEPTLPTAPFLPDRGADGLKVLGGSLLLALAAMALVEVFNRAPAPAAGPSTMTVVVPAGYGADRLTLPGNTLPSARPGEAQLAVAAPALLARATPPRPALEQPEAGALLAAARGPVRGAAALALMGLSATELLALRAGDLDLAAKTLRVGGAWGRDLLLPDWLASALATGRGSDAPMFASADGQPLAEDDLNALLACAAVDGGLSAGATLDASLLRDTCIDWLVGQGLRLSDLPALVGRIEPTRVAALAARAPGGPSPPADAVALLMPAVRLAPLA